MPSNRFPMGDSLQEYIKGELLKELKKSLDSGIQHPNCEWCWLNEQNKMKSHRISESRGSGLKSIHIRLSNVCNFKCRMCNPSFSSTWAQENKKHNYFTKMDNEITKDAIEANGDVLFKILSSAIRSGSLKYLSISGGEPLITDSHLKLLNFLIENDLTDITLGYSTNLSNLNYKNVDLLPLWEKFTHVNLEASVDGWGPHVEYSRDGFSCKTFLTNFKKSFKFIDAINCVVNIYSVWTLPYIERFRKYGINIEYSPCFGPKHCNPQILLKEDKDVLFDLYKDYPELLKVFKNFIDNIDSSVYTYDKLEKTRTDMINYNLLLDSYRNTSFFDVFPMYKKYLRS